MSAEREKVHTVLFDQDRCVACVACTKACPSRAIRVRKGFAHRDPDLCIDCGECIRACPHEAVAAHTSSAADLKRFRCNVAIPSMTIYSQFGPDVSPSQVVRALTRVGFDATYDMSFTCEMVGRAVDAYLADCKGPWPRISITCPAIVRLIQIRYPDMVPLLMPIRAPRELTAKLARRRIAQERGLAQEEIGVFHTTPCSAIVQSIVSPVGSEESYFDGAFSIAELYAPLRRAIEEDGDGPAEMSFSPKGLLWAIAGGQTSMMRSANTLTLHGVQDVTYVFDRIEAGKFRSVDFIEAYICPDGCVSGPLLVEGRYSAMHNIQQVVERLGLQDSVREEKVRSLYEDHFFDLEDEVRARTIEPPARDLREAARLRQEREEILARLPRKDCAACGAPDCRTHAQDVLAGEAVLEDCVFVKLESLGALPGGVATPARGAGAADAGGAGMPHSGGEAEMSRQMLLMDVSCPNCDRTLTEGDRVHLDAWVKETGQDGEVRLSAVFGDDSIETDLELPGGAVLDLRCPGCEKSLLLNMRCKLCGAPMASLNIRSGGYLEICTRRGCKAHALGGFGDVDQMMALVNRMFGTPHD